MILPVSLFYLSKDEPNKSCLLALQKIILNQHEVIIETVKWGIPCFCYDKKPFCYLSIDKKTNEPYLLMVEGRRLDHPQLEQGTRIKMKILRVNPTIDLEIELIEEILQAALALY